MGPDQTRMGDRCGEHPKETHCKGRTRTTDPRQERPTTGSRTSPDFFGPSVVGPRGETQDFRVRDETPRRVGWRRVGTSSSQLESSGPGSSPFLDSLCLVTRNGCGVEGSGVEGSGSGRDGPGPGVGSWRDSRLKKVTERPGRPEEGGDRKGW